MQTKREKQRPDPESLYRTRWLLAHNAIHSIVYDDAATVKTAWRAYLKQLRNSEELARQPA
ncbi:MAG: hypothetical protein ABR898_08525 [Terracidiphilus sp.]